MCEGIKQEGEKNFPGPWWWQREECDLCCCGLHTGGRQMQRHRYACGVVCRMEEGMGWWGKERREYSKGPQSSWFRKWFILPCDWKLYQLWIHFLVGNKKFEVRIQTTWVLYQLLTKLNCPGHGILSVTKSFYQSAHRGQPSICEGLSEDSALHVE